MNTRTFQKKRKRKRLILQARMRTKYEKKVEVRFLDGSIIKLKQGMASQFKRLYPMPDRNKDQNIDYGPREEIEKTQAQAGPLGPEGAEVIKGVMKSKK